MGAITTKGGLVKETDKQVSVHFDSIPEFMEYKLPAGSTNIEFWRRFTNRNDRHDRRWIGKTNKTVGDVIDHALAGDDEMEKTLEEITRQFRESIGADRLDFAQPITKRKRKATMSDFGDELDIHKVYQGKCDVAWRSMRRIETDNIHPLVTLVVDVVGNAHENCDSSLWGAALAMFVAEELRKAGKAVKIVVAEAGVSAMTRNNKILTTSIVIKHFNENVPAKRIAAMTHFGFFRVFNFAMMAVQDNKLHYGLGTSTSMKEQHYPIHLKEEAATGAVKFVNVGRVRNLAQAKQGLKNIYHQIGEKK